MGQNRAILLTPPGTGAIAVVRLIGPAVEAFLREHFSKPPRVNVPTYGTIRDDKGNVLDDCVVLLHESGGGVDINCHGGEWIKREMLSLAEKAGFELRRGSALPLSEDEVDAPDEIGREIQMYLPLAGTELALRALLAQERAWKQLEATVSDYSRERIADILEDRSLHWLLHPPSVAIVGAANVGKSTLANKLFGQERSITADLPGTTRDWIGEIANLDGLAVQLVDTPGIRQTDDPIERDAIRLSEAGLRDADLVILVLDASRPLEPEQSPLVERYASAMIAINKSDLHPVWERSRFTGIQCVGTTGKGVEKLMRSTRSYFGCERVDLNLPKCWTQRQRDFLTNQLK